MGGDKVKGLRLQGHLSDMFTAVCAENGYEQRAIVESLFWHFVRCTPDERSRMTRTWAMAKENTRGIWDEFHATNPEIQHNMTQEPSEVKAEKPAAVSKGGGRGKRD